MNFITSSCQLRHLCQEILPRCEFICIDTEFCREKTYFPILSLIQIAAGQDIFLIDALEEMDFSYLKDFFQAFTGEIIMFSARQDLETFYHRLGFLPQRVFDVQIALEVLGNPPCMGYGNAVQTYLNILLDKSHQYSNWLQRPLKEQQLSYAANDVIHLGNLYLSVKKQIKSSFKLEWLLEDMEVLSNPDTYKVDPAHGWKRCRLQSGDKGYFLRLQLLAAFREREALAQDIPRSHVIPGKLLQEIALKGKLLPGLRQRYRPLVEKLLKEQTEHKLVDIPLNSSSYAIPTEILMLGRWVRDWLVKQYGFHPSYLANNSEFDSLLRQQPSGRLKAGWRYHLLTQPMLDCLNGRQGITVDKGALKWGKVTL